MNEASATLAISIEACIGRVRASVEQLQSRGLVNGNVRMSSADGEVVVSVDRRGRLITLELAPGSTARLPCDTLECLINATLRKAVNLAVRTELPA
ncbi:hypothetical protein ACP6C7_06270 [Mycolicibacterium septicum]|uniref:Uncharacterized protein n=1 Tax=Mycolicibacterium septicum TaxID=98668 RepID=A0ABW9LMH9_9MYCO